MKTTTLVITLALVGLVAVAPGASADHSGPTCTHEYIDHYKHLGQVVPACLRNTGQWVEDFVGVQVQLPG